MSDTMKYGTISKQLVYAILKCTKHFYVFGIPRKWCNLESDETL